MQIRAKSYVIAAIIGLLGPVFSVLAYNLYIDPFQIFHKDFDRPMVLLGGRGADRYQHAGIINQYTVQSAVIGHSHGANFLPEAIEDKLRWKSIHSFTMDGSMLNTHSQMMKRLFSKHEIENILWGISDRNLITQWDKLNEKIGFTDYLYDNNRLNDIRFFLSLDLQRYETRKREKRDKYHLSSDIKAIEKREFNLATSWYDGVSCDFNKPAHIADIITRSDPILYRGRNLGRLAPIAAAQLLRNPSEKNDRYLRYGQNLKNNILPHIRNNPETRFHIILTPNPTYFWQKRKIRSFRAYKTYFQIRRAFVRDMSLFPNVFVYGFDNEPFTSDLRLYKDNAHYHIEVNNYILERIARQENRLTLENIDDYLLAMDKKVSNYRLPDKWKYWRKETIWNSGYLSSKAARLLIHDTGSYSDEDITQMSYQDSNLPECAANFAQVNGSVSDKNQK